MNKPKTTNQVIKRVPLSEIETESGYQRETNAAQVQNITLGFDEARLGVITVSQRGGKFHVIDGMHRTHAMRNLGYTHAVCIVCSDLTYEQEADLYTKQNEGKRMLRPFDIFKGGLEAVNEIPVEISEIVKANGFQLGAGGRKDYYRITAIKALEAIAKEYGFAVLDDTLCLIASTWPGLTKATKSATLLGVAEFVYRYGMAEFAERMKEKCMSVWYYYEEEMRNRNAAVFSIPPRHRFCRILVEQYNQGLAARNKKRLIWEN
jgi:hypothetical protein